ncbi:MAG: hypothetical protein HGA51_11245, partial [Demequinaceae bacterium]|nr:hypothetical protein [Demequinaceae bacterium]
DPVNCTDLGGTFSWKGLAKVVAVVAETASMFVPGPVGAAVGAVAAGAYLAAGDKDAAKMAAIGAAATLVGAGLAVAAVKAARVVKTAQALGRLATRAAPKVERAVVIGQSMSRVEAAAKELGAGTYKAWKGWGRMAGPTNGLLARQRTAVADVISHLHSRAWIRSARRAGGAVYDIGRDLAKTSPSPFYRMERSVMRGARNHFRVYWPAS